MAANVEAMVREGTNALKAGRKEEARALLMKAVELDELNEDAWLWLSAVVETEEDQQTCLENVLAINPTNERARQGLKYLEQQRSGGAPAVSAPPPPPATPPPVYSSTPAPTPATSSSVEWSAPTDEPSDPKAPARASDLSEEDYDNWVSTLNLPTAAKPSSSAKETAPSATPFFDEDEDEIEEPSFDLDMPAGATSADPKGKARVGKSKAPVPDFDDDFDFEASDEQVPEGKGKRRMPKMALPAMPKREKVEKPPRERAAKPKPEAIEPLFAEIPEEIRATRMPGTNERLSPLVVLLLVIVLSANIAVAILLVQTLFPA